MVLKEGKYFGRPFCMMRGVTHGQPLSLTIFNIVVDAVVRACMVEVCGPQEEHHSFGWVLGKHNIVLYEDDGLISGRNPLWVKTTLKAMVRMFADKHGQDQSNGIHTGVHLRATGGSVIQEESNCRRRHFWVAEENQGKWSRVWRYN